MSTSGHISLFEAVYFKSVIFASLYTTYRIPFLDVLSSPTIYELISARGKNLH